MKRQKLTMGALKRLLALYNGEELTQSETQTRLFDRMKRDGVLIPATQHGARTISGSQKLMICRRQKWQSRCRSFDMQRQVLWKDFMLLP